MAVDHVSAPACTVPGHEWVMAQDELMIAVAYLSEVLNTLKECIEVGFLHPVLIVISHDEVLFPVQFLQILACWNSVTEEDIPKDIYRVVLFDTPVPPLAQLGIHLI
jgi:hypothetical protein